jgi:r-opsin
LNPLWHGILGFVILVLGLISWTGNGVVVYVFSCTKGLRTPSNMFVVNLAVSDFLMMVVMSPPMVFNCYFETWMLGTVKLFICAVKHMVFVLVSSG